MLISLYSIVCLHTNGRLRKIYLNAPWEYTPPGFYYPFDSEDIAINKDNFNDDDFDYSSLGADDFIAFNLMSLLIIDPLWSLHHENCPLLLARTLYTCSTLYCNYILDLCCFYLSFHVQSNYGKY